MSKWNMIVDVAKCENCHNCFLAVKDEHIGNDFPGYAAPQPLHGHTWIDIKRVERGQAPIVDAHAMPVMCNHCDDAPCIRASTGGAMYQRPDGIVMIDPQKAKGQKQLVRSCPYGAIYWNDELDLPQKWIFDAHLLDNGWTKTRAEQVCGTGALRSLKIEDAEMQQIAAREKLEVLLPKAGTKPRVYYRNLHLMEKAFVGGTVVTSRTGVEECLAGAQVALAKNGVSVGQATTDAFGEFRIDGLDPGSGEYELTVSDGGAAVARRTISLGESLYAGVFEL